MKKTSLAVSAVLLIAVMVFLVGHSALAQNAAPGGPAQPDAPQKKVLDNALSPETRKTLQDTIDSMNLSEIAIKQVDLGPGEGAEMDGTQVDQVAFAHLPARLRAALGGNTQRALSSSASP